MEDKARIGTEIKKHLLPTSWEIEIRLSEQGVRIHQDNNNNNRLKHSTTFPFCSLLGSINIRQFNHQSCRHSTLNQEGRLRNNFVFKAQSENRYRPKMKLLEGSLS